VASDRATEIQAFFKSSFIFQVNRPDEAEFIDELLFSFSSYKIVTHFVHRSSRFKVQLARVGDDKSHEYFVRQT
jgi:hypothetical protein